MPLIALEPFDFMSFFVLSDLLFSSSNPLYGGIEFNKCIRLAIVIPLRIYSLVNCGKAFNAAVSIACGLSDLSLWSVSVCSDFSG